jgi:hypothetical protein
MKPKVQVSRRALTQRINRRLAENGLVLKLTKGNQAKKDVGKYFIIDTARNEIKETHVDLERCARKHDCLALWEELC